MLEVWLVRILVEKVRFCFGPGVSIVSLNNLHPKTLKRYQFARDETIGNTHLVMPSER